MQPIHAFRWLAEVINCLGGTPPQMDIMEYEQFRRLTISFKVPAREGLGRMILIVKSGKESPVVMTYERTAMEACLLEL